MLALSCARRKENEEEDTHNSEYASQGDKSDKRSKNDLCSIEKKSQSLASTRAIRSGMYMQYMYNILYIYICICMYVCIYVCIYMWMYVCIYVYVYICIYTYM
jgi:hypothetical protein